MYFLIRFTYDYYCQGYEDATETILVRADNFTLATRAISSKYQNARDFVNMTIMA